MVAVAVETLKTLRAWLWLAMALLVLVSSGCAPVRPRAPEFVNVPDYNYIVGPGDVLNVTVWRNPELSGSAPVRPDGKITSPLVEDLVAMGKDSSTIAREIEAKLAKYIRDPVVTVVVTSFIGPYSEQIRVIGEAARPQTLPYKQKMTLLDVMIVVGGLTDFADGNRSYIVRSAENNKQYSVRLHDLIKGGDITANAEVRPGDILIIPQSWF